MINIVYNECITEIRIKINDEGLILNMTRVLFIVLGIQCLPV